MSGTDTSGDKRQSISIYDDTVIKDSIYIEGVVSDSW